jgi:hypothetical protein
MRDRASVERESRADPRPHGEETPSRGPLCPHCGEVLTQGTAVLTSGMIPGAAYCCTDCRILYTLDLKLFARIVG